MTDREQIDEKLIQIFTEECVQVFEHGGCIIHFPEITISNENGTERILYDLFVQLVWEYGIDNNKDKVVTFTTVLKGVRTTFTPEDIYNCYSHSHLNSFSRSQKDDGHYKAEPCFTDFCLGEDSLYNTMAELNMGFNIDKFIILLNSIDEFVRWESVAGGPYILMEELNLGGYGFSQLSDGSVSPPLTPSALLKYFFENISEPDLKDLTFIHDTLDTSLSTDKIIEIWESMAINSDYYIDLTSPIFKYENKYYIQDQGYQAMLTMAKKIEWGPKIHFKEEELDYVVKFDDTEGKDIAIENEGVRVPHPQIAHVLIEELEKKLHKYLTKTDKWKLTKQLIQF